MPTRFPVEIAHICALSRNHCIGKNNHMPWHISDDLKRFKQKTQGGIIVLGRKTYDSFGQKPLPKRSHWVITRQADWQSGFTNTDETEVYHASSTNQALNAAANQALKRQLKTVWVIGGGEIFEQTIGFTDRLELTHVDADIDGDSFYPAIPKNFTITNQSKNHDENANLDYYYVSYQRAK